MLTPPQELGGNLLENAWLPPKLLQLQPYLQTMSDLVYTGVLSPFPEVDAVWPEEHLC